MSAAQTLLMCDLVDSTGITQRLGDEAARELWSAHDRMSRELLFVWSGLEIDRSDGFLLLFADPAGAAGYALEYVQRLGGLPEPVHARVALHATRIDLHHNSEEDVARGAKPIEVKNWLAKAVTARIMSLARGGHVLASAAVVQGLEETAVRVRSHGHWRMQGLEEPLEVFELGAEGHHFEPPADAPKAWRVVERNGVWTPQRDIHHTLPAERDEFIGRRAELKALAGLLDNGARLVTLHGAGGCGKTRLAQRFGWTWLGDFPGGVWFCDLSAATSFDGVTYAVAQGLDVRLGGGDPVVRLGDALAGRSRCLVVLDNFEQVVAHAESTVGAWLDRASEACMLVTSREVLGIVGEEVLAIDPMMHADATELFQRRVESVRVGSLASAEDKRAVEPLVRLLDGLPLAIELAASRTRAMTLTSLLSRMSRRFEVLAARSGRRDRQATLRATFDWSWELLSDRERAALARLSVFGGSFGPDAAADVISPSDAGDAFEPIQALVEKSLLRPLENGRFELLTSVREYAAERLQAPGSFDGSGPACEQDAQRRHEKHFIGHDATRVERESGIELDNLVLACRRAATRGAAHQAALALEGAWAALKLRGPFRTGIELAESVARIPGIEGADAAAAHLTAGYALQSCGAIAQARECYERAMLEARSAGDRRRETSALASLAELQLLSGEMEPAGRNFEQALSLARSIHASVQECAVLNGLGTFHEHLGHLDQASEMYEQSLALARKVGHRRWEGGALGNLGQLRANQGRATEARQAYESALAIAREFGDRQWEGNTLCNLGLLEFTTELLGAARRHLSESREIARRIGHRRLECVVECNIGLVCDAEGDLDRAEFHLQAALSIARELRDRRTEGQTLGYLALTHAKQCLFDRARQEVRQGTELLAGVSDSLSLGVIACIETMLERRAGRFEQALDAYRRARVLADELKPGRDSELGKLLQSVEADAPSGPPS